MTWRVWFAAALLLVAAVSVAMPRAGATGRWHGVFQVRRERRSSGRLRAVRPDALLALSAGSARLAVAGLACCAGVVATAVAGPVAGVVAVVYSAGAAGGALRALRMRADGHDLNRAVEAVGMLAADLRAGVPVPAAVEATREAVDRAPDVAVRVTAALLVADRTGAPVAEVLDRLDADLRATARLRAATAAQAAGSRASAWLLAVLPLAGVALGPAVGADSARVVLHSPLGAGCVFAAVALQIGGLAWSFRLARGGA